MFNNVHQLCGDSMPHDGVRIAFYLRGKAGFACGEAGLRVSTLDRKDSAHAEDLNCPSHNCSSIFSWQSLTIELLTSALG